MSYLKTNKLKAFITLKLLHMNKLEDAKEMEKNSLMA